MAWFVDATRISQIAWYNWILGQSSGDFGIPAWPGYGVAAGSNRAV